MIALVPDHIQQPDETSGPAATFVVIHHVDRLGVVPEFTEQRLQGRLGWQQSWGRRLAELGALGVDEACSGICPVL